MAGQGGNFICAGRMRRSASGSNGRRPPGGCRRRGACSVIMIFHIMENCVLVLLYRVLPRHTQIKANQKTCASEDKKSSPLLGCFNPQFAWQSFIIYDALEIFVGISDVVTRLGKSISA